MPDISHDPLYLWLTRARLTTETGAPTPADMPTRRPTAATASDIACREGLDLGDLAPTSAETGAPAGAGDASPPCFKP
ncbi:hypothetical protein AB0E27_10910 [Streptomyces sparsogenes]|uniref:hypothetical protein n=1 Tax=Streptomyces sparsogenes TaxID=67365 RepID=UPI0033DC3C38